MGAWQPIDVIFDTGSDMLMVESHDCWNCEGRGNSTGEVWNTTRDMIEENRDRRPSQRVYGEVFLKGYNWYDKVCLTLSKCVSNFTYFAILEQTGIVEPVDGILGMSRNSEWRNSDPSAKGERTIGPLFVEAMVEEGIIDDNIFTFAVDSSSDSRVYFG